jgi:glycerophosphoryl diester phosphodiesterase
MKIIAHRGCSKKFSGNSLEAVQEALCLDVDLVEVDIQECSDGILVCHDYYLKDGTPVRNLLQSCGQKRGLLTLEQLLKICKNKNVMLDLKQAGDNPSFVDKVVHIIVRSRHKKCFVASFNEFHLRYLNNYRKTYGSLFTLGHITCSTNIDYYSKLIDEFSLDCLVVCKQHVTKNMVKHVNIPIYVFTVDTKHEFEEIKQMGVAGIITNIPSQFLSG